MKKDAVAGQFYPEEPVALEKTVDGCFLSKLGPGILPKTGKKHPAITSMIVPHAGLMFSGPCAAFAYKEFAETKTPKTILLLGVNHRSRKSCLSDKDWETKYGIFRCNKKLVKDLRERGMIIDNKAHLQEHSLEVQLPFIHRSADNAMIACLLVSDDDHKRLADQIMECIDDDTTIICSSDFTHYGPDYGFLTYGKNSRALMEHIDMPAIEHITDPDPEGFLSKANKTTICGMHGIAVLLEIMKRKGKKGELLKYYTSGDVLGDYTNAVGYASIVFR